MSFWGGGGELGLNRLVHVKGSGSQTHSTHCISAHKVSFGVTFLSTTVGISEQTVAFLCPIFLEELKFVSFKNSTIMKTRINKSKTSG